MCIYWKDIGKPDISKLKVIIVGKLANKQIFAYLTKNVLCGNLKMVTECKYY